jgi:large subunit ribosomal protein L25
MATIEFTAFKRDAEGRGASRRLRKSGRAPGVVYGGTVAPTPIELDHNALIHALRNEAFHSSILTMKLDGSGTQVLLRDVQMHPFRHEILHIDFQRIDPSRRIHMKVPLHFVNADKSPGVKEQGGIASHVLNELDITCFPDDLPEFIEVDLSNLTVGHSLHVREVALPKGVELAIHKSENPVVATVVIPSLITEEEEAAAAAAAVAPSEVPTTEQAAAPKEGEGAPGEGEKGDKGDKGKGAAAEKPAAADKGEKKEKK